MSAYANDPPYEFPCTWQRVGELDVPKGWDVGGEVNGMA